MVGLNGPTKLCTRQSFLDGCQPILQGAQVRHNDADMSLNDLRRSRREVKLLFTNVCPHVAQTNI
jgi:hypothetical protein